MTMNIRPFSMITSIFNTKLPKGELHEMEIIDGSPLGTTDGWDSLMIVRLSIRSEKTLGLKSR